MNITRKALFVGATVAAVAAVPGTAFADSCSNVSRAPAPCGDTCTGPVIVGNWVWLPSIGAPENAWAFSPPGTPFSTGLLGVVLPDANGNYINSQGNFAWLLENSAWCNGGATSRQRVHGVQSGCGA